ncbi:MAG: hypothetical protein HY002_11065 [Candidatus Rokubacteria bacterium]|nr:hypothetical protein [Candidatus Rokubacteria bacterium]
MECRSCVCGSCPNPDLTVVAEDVERTFVEIKDEAAVVAARRAGAGAGGG